LRSSSGKVCHACGLLVRSTPLRVAGAFAVRCDEALVASTHELCMRRNAITGCRWCVRLALRRSAGSVASRAMHATKRHNWVCLECRRALRRSAFSDHEVSCSQCGGPCELVESPKQIPARDDHDGWDELAAQLDERRPGRIEWLEQVQERAHGRSDKWSIRRATVRRARIRQLREIQAKRQPAAQSAKPRQVPRRGMERALQAAEEADAAE